MDVVYFQTQLLNQALGKAQGALQRYREQIRVFKSMSEIKDIIIVAQDSDAPALVVAFRTQVTVVLRSGNDAVTQNNHPILVLEDPNTCMTERWIQRLLAIAHRQVGRKVLRGKARPVGEGLRCNGRLLSTELSCLLRGQSCRIQDLSGMPWKPEDLVFEEDIFTDKEDERCAYAMRLKTTSFPAQLALEPSNACNLACTMCPYHSERYRDPPVGPYIPESQFMMMAPHLFKRLVDEAVAENVLLLIPQYRGEPFRHPQFMELLEYAVGKGLLVSFPTNAMLLDEGMIRRLVDMGLPQIQFSVDALDRDLYHKIRQNADIDKVVNTIRRIRDYRDAQGKKKPRMGMTFVELNLNRHEREAYVKHYLTLVDFVRVSVGLTYEELHHNLPFQYFECIDTDRPPCRLLLDQIMVTSDGKAVLCHTDSMQSCVVGDLNQQSIREVFNGEAMQRVRQAHAERQFDVTPICAQCQIWKADINVPLTSYDPEHVEVYGGPMGLAFFNKVVAVDTRCEKVRDSGARPSRVAGKCDEISKADQAAKRTTANPVNASWIHRLFKRHKVG